MANEIKEKAKCSDSCYHAEFGINNDRVFKQQREQSFVYNSSADYDCMGYEIIQSAGSFGYDLKNSSTGETLNLVRSSMFGAFSDEEKVRCYCVCSPYLYYTTSVTESYINRIGNYNSSITKVSVVCR